MHICCYLIPADGKGVQKKKKKQGDGECLYFLTGQRKKMQAVQPALYS
jgi:hypothetical protein